MSKKSIEYVAPTLKEFAMIYPSHNISTSTLWKYLLNINIKHLYQQYLL